MNHSPLHWLARLACAFPFALLLSTCSTDDDSNPACESLCSDVCQTLPGCGLAVAANCTDECLAGLGGLDCADARPVGQLTCDELNELYVCAEYCATLCTTAAACAPFDERLCTIGCASDPVLCNPKSVAARSCDQLKPEARRYEDLGRAQESDSYDIEFGGTSLAPYGLCGDADDCEAPLGCSAETNTCAACVSDAECAKGFALQPIVCTADGACLEVECASDDDCFDGSSCDAQTHTCIECTRDEECADGISASLRPVCEIEIKTCVQCTGDEHCASGFLPACDVENNDCVECTRNEHCSSPRGVCRTSESRCVECLTHADCPAESPRCDDSGYCMYCESNAECVLHGYTACSLSRCVECTSNLDCTDPALPECDTLIGQCLSAQP